MAGGSFKAPLFTVAWPTGEFGGMGLEGAVKLGFRKELAAIEDPERAQAAVRAHGRARLRARQGAEHGDALRDRRRDRPGRVAALDHAARCARRRRRRRGRTRSGRASTRGEGGAARPTRRAASTVGISWARPFRPNLSGSATRKPFDRPRYATSASASPRQPLQVMPFSLMNRRHAALSERRVRLTRGEPRVPSAYVSPDFSPQRR